MPARLSSLSRNRGQVTLENEDGSTITIVYRPGSITPRQLHRIQALRDSTGELSQQEMDGMLDEQTRLLAASLISWDLIDEDDNPIPATYEGLQDVDYEAQAVFLQLIAEDQQLGKGSASGTSPGSSTPVSASPAPDQTISSFPPSRSGTPSRRQRAG